MTDLKTLYNIEDAYIQLMNEIEEAEGILTPEMEEQLAIVEDTFEAKCRAYGVRRKFIKGEILVLKDEKTRFDTAIKSKENLSQRLVDRLIPALELFGAETKSGGRQYKDTFVNMYTVNKDQVVVTKDDVIDFADYSIVNVDLHLTAMQIQEVFKFIVDKYGKDKVVQKGVALKKKAFMEASKAGIIVKNKYYFDSAGQSIDMLTANELSADGDTVEVREIFTNKSNGQTYPHVDIVNNTSLTQR